MNEDASSLVGFRVYCRKDLPTGFDLWFSGEDARELFKVCLDAHSIFQSFPLELKEEFIQKAKEDLAQFGGTEDIRSLRVKELGTTLGLGPPRRWPVIIYILRREDRIPLGETNGIVLLREP